MPDDRYREYLPSEAIKNCCGKSKRSGFDRYLTCGETGGREVLRVILPKACQPLKRYNDYFYLNTYPYGSPTERNGAEDSKGET